MTQNAVASDGIRHFPNLGAKLGGWHAWHVVCSSLGVTLTGESKMFGLTLALAWVVAIGCGIVASK